LAWIEKDFEDYMAKNLVVEMAEAQRLLQEYSAEHGTLLLDLIKNAFSTIE
jgi:hypothetical protein